MTISVRCTFEIDVEVPDGTNKDDIRFQIEDNGCPGTGLVWEQLKKQMDEDEEKSVCWACNLKGRNQIVRWIE